MKEQSIQAKILKHLKANGFYTVKVITASKAGISDILACSPNGIFWSIEVKKPGGVVSDIQKYNLRQVLKRNGIAFHAHSYDIYLLKYNEATIVEANRLKAFTNK